MKDLESLSTTDLFTLYMVAGTDGEFGKAYAIVDEMCRSERAGSCKDLLPLPETFKAFKSYSKEMLQGMTDRVEQYNSYIR